MTEGHYEVIRVLSYRNGFYQGQLRAGRKHGRGVLITDAGEIIVGQWKSDQLFGNAFVWIKCDEYAFMDFNRGELEGHCYHRAGEQMLLIEFNGNRPIGKQLLANFEEKRVQIVSYRSPAYEINESYEIQETDPAKLIERHLRMKYECLSISEYLEKYFLQTSDLFEMKALPNGYIIFKFNDKSNPLSLGFVLNKDRIMSYGCYVNDKLHGFGCKFESNVRYYGIFYNGFLNGLGLKYGSGKYSFGRFENGNLVDAIYLYYRSPASEYKLRELKRREHIKSINFFNCYLYRYIIKFKGIQEVVFYSKVQKEYLYPQNSTKKSKVANNSLNTKLSKTDRKQIYDYDAKSIKTFDYKPNRNPYDYEVSSYTGKYNPPQSFNKRLLNR